MNEHEETEDLQAPAKLAEAFCGLQKERVLVPSQIDQEILSKAREHLRGSKRPFFSLPRWVALAASVALVCGLIYLSETRDKTFAAEDINRDGVVDILDALALARKIEAGEKGEMDFNRDGVIDERDAATIAIDVVRLGRGGRS